MYCCTASPSPLSPLPVALSACAVKNNIKITTTIKLPKLALRNNREEGDERRWRDRKAEGQEKREREREILRFSYFEFFASV